MEPSGSEKTTFEVELLTVLIALDEGVVSLEQLRQTLAEFTRIQSSSIELLLEKRLSAGDCDRMDICNARARKLLSARGFGLKNELAKNEIALLPFDPPLIGYQSSPKDPAVLAADFDFAAQARVAFEESGVPYVELENEPEQEPSAPESTWKETSEFWSHVLYLDDIVRSYTAGWLGILHLALLLTAALLLAAFFPTSRSTESPEIAPAVNELPQQKSKERELVEQQSVGNATPVKTAERIASELSSGARATNDLETEFQSSSTDPAGDADLVELAAEKAELELENSRESMQASPNIEFDETQSRSLVKTPEVGFADSPETRAEPELSIDASAELETLLNFIQASDYVEAKRTLGKLRAASRGNDPLVEQLLFGVLLEHETADSIQEAGGLLASLDVENDRNSQCLMVRWAMLSNPDQRKAFYQQLTEKSDQGAAIPSLPAICLSAMDRENQTASELLRARIKSDKKNLANHFFLAVAELLKGNRQDALQQLDQTQQLLNADQLSGGSAIEEWLRVSNQTAIGQGVEKLRGRLKIPN